MPGTTTFRAVPWSEELRTIFTLAASDWTPPAMIRSSTNAKRDRATFRAKFTQPDGSPVTLTVKAKRDAEGRWWETAQHMDLRLQFKAGEARG